MSGHGEDRSAFLGELERAISSGTFVRVTLGKFRGRGETQKIVVTLIKIKAVPNLRFVVSYPSKDVTENTVVAAGIARIDALLGQEFLSATLFTTQDDVTLIFSKKKHAVMSRSKPTFTQAQPTEHDRAKTYPVDPARSYLKQLGITLADGRVKPSMYPKFKQICHFIEIVDDLLRVSELATATSISVVDIGSGKGYLTFALYDYLSTRSKKSCLCTGVELRADLVAFCNALAKQLHFDGLSFEAALAAATEPKPVDIVIALHACDTATDDAIAHGVFANAALIICAPCCQHELAPQLSRSADAVSGLMRFGLFKQRQADLVTDAARCLLMEAAGYKLKVIEFVSTEHTAKNILIAGIRSSDVDRAAARKEYAALKAFFGFATHRLEQRLAER